MLGLFAEDEDELEPPRLIAFRTSYESNGSRHLRSTNHLAAQCMTKVSTPRIRRPG